MTTPDITDETTERGPRHWPWWVPWTAALAVAAIVIGVGSWVVLTPSRTDDTDGRAVYLVEWQPDAQPRLLATAADIQQARQTGDVTVSEPGIVVNMPITVWPGGQR